MKKTFNENKNYYALLGVSETASKDTLDKVIGDIARNSFNGQELSDFQVDMLAELWEAYNVLSDSTTRKEYDLARKRKAKNNKTILDYAKDDKKFNDFIRNFLIKTIWINFDKNVVIDPVDSYNIARTKQAINILYDKSNHFDDYEIDFKKFLDEFFKKSKILSTAKVAQELFDKIKLNKNILEKKEQKKFEKVNTKNVEKLPNFDKIKELFKEIEIINSSNDNNLNKTKRFLDLIEKSDYTKK